MALMRREPNYRSNLSPDEKVVMAVVRAAEIFKRAHSAVFRGYGLSFPQYNVLRVLDASKGGRNKITDVSRIMLVPGANVTGIAKRLEKGGFIIRKSDPRDERVTMLQITPKGKTALQRIEKEKDEWTALILVGFSQKEKHHLLDQIRKLITNHVEGADRARNQQKTPIGLLKNNPYFKRYDEPL